MNKQQIPKRVNPNRGQATAGSSHTLDRIDFALRHRNRSLATGQFLELLRREAPEFFAQAMVVGKWVWLSFREAQPKRVTATLAQLGFHWSRRRNCWQNPCGCFSDAVSTGDPRKTYRCYFPAGTRKA